jgi:hypothetical protein
VSVTGIGLPGNKMREGMAYISAIAFSSRVRRAAE